MREYSCDSVAALWEALRTISGEWGGFPAWWRGQAESTWDLVPSLLRLEVVGKEFNMVIRFMNRAKAIHNKCPANSDLQGWLSLMQHYRLPTRLLDWSESPLVALFFALEDKKHDGEDGALWALRPSALNHCHSGEKRILLPHHPKAASLFRQAFNLPVPKPERIVLAVLTERHDIRHLVQHAVMTIHGDSTPINKSIEADECLIQIRIPKASKALFRSMLETFHIDRASLFPDLEGLASNLRETQFKADE
jgi:FRG domain